MAAFKYVEEDTHELFNQISRQFPEAVKVLLGRSLGTFQIACVLDKRLGQPRQIVWQCPSLYEQWPLVKSCGISGLGIIGTIDDRYEAALPHLPLDRVIIEGANHAMEIPGDPIQSIEVLKRVIQGTNDWLLPAGRGY